MDDSNAVLRRNYLAWCEYHGKTRTWLGNTDKVPLGLLQRALSESQSITLSSLQKLADAMGLQAWQLLFPGFDPSNPPTLVIHEAERRLYAQWIALRTQLQAAPVSYSLHEPPSPPYVVAPTPSPTP